MRLAALLAASLALAVPAIVLAQPAEAQPAAVAVPAATPPAGAPVAPAAPTKPPKSGMYFGFSLGTGKGTMTNGASSVDIDQVLQASGSSPTTLALQLRAGFGSGDLLLGTQLNLTRTWIDVGGTSAGLEFSAIDLVATWWSQEMGLYTRLGVGPSQFSVFGGNYTSNSVSGVELMAGIGLTTGGLGVGIDVFRQSYNANEAGFDSVTYALAMLSLDLY